MNAPIKTVIQHAPASDFRRVSHPDPHIARRKAILSKHPEIRQLYGSNPASFLLIIFLVCLQLALAALLSHQAWWLVLASAFLLGAYPSASLYALIHDASHKLIFSSVTANRLAAIVANIPLVMVSAEPFRRYHYDHHAKMGNYQMDVGIPTLWEAQWVGKNPVRKFLWLTFFVVFQLGRTMKYVEKKPFMHGWMALNLGFMLLVDSAILHFFGFASLVYLFLCFFFAFGFHSLGARVIQEHFMLEDGQETNNFTGKSGIFECNFGLHNEHHDFPRIPWNRLPAVTQLAPEFYATLKHHPSRWKLILTFISDSQWDLYRHTVRTPRDAKDE
jgi:sphingolipid delta-4 desaturase